MKKIFIDREKLRRELYGRQQEVAKVLGIHPTTLSRKVSGSVHLSLDEELNKIAEALERDTSFFLREVEA